MHNNSSTLTLENSVATSSSSSHDRNASTPVKPKPGEIPFVRKRLQYEQTIALITFFEHNTHPSKEERVALAEELGIELKTVSSWFQNRRRSIKKKALVWTRSFQENRAHGSKRHPGRQGSCISLDSVASSRERLTKSDIPSPSRPPLTPRRINGIKRFDDHPLQKEAPNLWDHIPSSPPAQPSSPGADRLRLTALSKRDRSSRSLEWACAHARTGKKEGYRKADWDVPPLDLDADARLMIADMDVIGEDTETEEYEAITPDVGTMLLTTPQLSSAVLTKKEGEKPSDDMEAAIALLGFMGGHSESTV